MMTIGRRLASAIVAAGALIGGASSVGAFEGIDAQNWKPTIDPYGYVTVDGARSLDFLQLHGAVYFNWAHNPLKLSRGRPTGGGRDVVRNLDQIDFVAGVGLLKFGKNGGLEIGADMPWAVDVDGVKIQPNDDTTLRGLATGTTGDLRTMAKLTLLDREDDVVGFGGKVELIFPTGHDESFLSDDRRFKQRYGLFLEKKMGPIRLGIEGEYEHIPGDIHIAGVQIDDKLWLKAGLAIEPFDKFPLALIVEAFHWTRIEHGWSNEEESPVEMGVAIKYSGTLFAMIGANAGLNEGVGSPDARVYAAIGITF